jgi:uncharacterized protein with PIN domain
VSASDLAHRLAAATGESLTGAVTTALRERLARARLARQAYRDFGKGNHPAGLNFGDCFSYALARAPPDLLRCSRATTSR